MAEYIILDEFLSEEAKESADAQGHLHELVRCKDCKKRNTWECWQYFFGRMNLPDDYYCADGKSKDGEQE